MGIQRLTTTQEDVSLAVPGRHQGPDGERAALWQVAEETPVAILLNGESFAVMMTTPADLEDFAMGFALTEGIVRHVSEIDSLALADAADGIVVNLKVSRTNKEMVEKRRRTLAGRAGCGICGAQTIAAALPPPPKVPRQPVPAYEALMAAFKALPALQRMKRANHTTHAAAFCSRDGDVLIVREDIGRHNALDKLAGALACDGKDASAGFILLSSRVSVEMVQKAAVIRAPLLAAVSAPSALALRAAARAGMTVVCRDAAGIMVFDPKSISGGLK